MSGRPAKKFRRKHSKPNLAICRRCRGSRSQSHDGLCNLCKVIDQSNARTYSSPTFVCLSAYCEKCLKTKMKDQFDKRKDGTEKLWCRECIALCNETKASHVEDVGGVFVKACDGNSYQERNLNLASIGFSSYADYLNSDLWATIRRRAYKRKGTGCSLCKEAAEEMHHNRYGLDDLLGKTFKHLHPLCATCHHNIEHDKGVKVLDLVAVRREFNRLFKLRPSCRR